MKSIKTRLSYANVTATLALFIALGGGAWALSKDSVGARAIRKDAVRSQEIDDGKIKAKDVKPETLGAGQIADGSIGVAELGENAVGSSELANGAVVQSKIAADAVGNNKIADGAVGTNKIADGAVNSAKIANGAVGKPEIAAGAVGSSEVADGSLNGGDVAADSLTGAQVDESSLGLVPDAAMLGGRSFVYGEADGTDSNADVIATLPALGAELQDDGTPDNDLEIVIANTGTAPKRDLACPNGTASAGPGSMDATGAPVGVNTMVCFAFDPSTPAGPSRALVFCANDTRSVLIRCEVLQTT